MSFSTKISNGWNITVNSFKILRANKDLILFPILSSVSIILIMASFFAAIFTTFGINFFKTDFVERKSLTGYLIMFAFYVVNYFVVVFFNMALIHCTHLYFKGEEVSVKKGLQFSLSKIDKIFMWSIFAGTVGFILKLIQERSGLIGKIVTGLIGIVWSIATFFVVPIIAYENVGPIGAIKRSTALMKQKWGESLVSRFSFGLIQLLAFILIGGALFLLGSMVNPFVGIVLAILAVFLIVTIMSAAQTIFISAVYHDVTDEPTTYFDQQLIDGLFQHK